MPSPAANDIAASPRVVIAITTFKRNDGLAALLGSIQDLSPLGGGWDFTGVVVVDNDPAGSAQEMVESAFPNVNYFCEPEPGIAAARNRSVAEAKALGATWVAFVDDDQTVTTSWLAELANVAQSSQVDAVVGAVRFHRPPQTPEWFIGLGAFDDQLVDQADMGGYFSTNNLLLRVDPWPVSPPLFDMRFGLTGGSDHHLGARIRAMGGTIGYAPDALAEETVLASRVNKKAAVKRILRYGNVLTRVELAVGEETGAQQSVIRVREGAAGIARVGYGMLKAAVQLPQGTQGVARGLRTSFIGIGQLYAAGGGVVEEYRRKDPSR